MTALRVGGLTGQREDRGLGDPWTLGEKIGEDVMGRGV